LKILFLSHVDHKYGAGRSLLSLARGLKSRGHEVHAIVPGEGELTRDLMDCGISTLQMSCPPWLLPRQTSFRAKFWYLRKIFATTIELTRQIKKLQPDLIHTNSLTIPSGALCAYFMGVPHVWHIREFGFEFDLEFILGKNLSTIFMGLSSKSIVVNSQSVARYFNHRFTRHKIVMVYNGIEPPPGEFCNTVQNTATKHFPTIHSPIKLVLVGMLQPAKGQIEAIEAVSILKSRGISCRLSLVGQDSLGYQRTLEKKISETGVGDSVVFTGHSINPYREFEESDIALFCSSHEAFGRVTVEAMLSHCPVIASNAGGTVEIIEEGINGWMYQTGDAQDLAGKIQSLAKMDPAELRKITDFAYDLALKKFSVNQYVDQIELIYTRILLDKHAN
jgi:glycosyltransferase involved in cell wall biosynthesis